MVSKFFSFIFFFSFSFVAVDLLFAQSPDFEDPFADFENEELPSEDGLDTDPDVESDTSPDIDWEEPEIIDYEEDSGELLDTTEPADSEELFEDEPQISTPTDEAAPPSDTALPSTSPSAPSTSFPEPPRIDDFYPDEAPPSPSLDRGIRFPEPEPTRGPVSEDVFRSKEISFDRSERPWHISGSIGVSPGIVDRPSGQVSFELGGGYRLWEKWELAGIINYRVREDRVLSLIVLPAYQASLWTRPNFRVDWRAGAGLGWSLRGVQGNDFQFGYLPIRTHASLLLYPAQNFSILLGLDTESFVFETQTGGGTRFLFASQAIFSTGVRFEF